MEKKEEKAGGATVPTPKKQKIGQKVVHKVRLISAHKRYARTPYPFTVPQSQSSGKLLTGQEEILTEAQMRGEEKLLAADKTKLQMGSNPFIINPDNMYPCKNARTFDLSYEINGPDPEDREYLVPKDFAEYTFFTRQHDLVAPSKSAYQKNKHLFYIEDAEKESRDELISIDRRWEAESFVRNEMASSRYPEVILLLNFEIPKYHIDPSTMSDTLIRSTVYKACQDHPETILKLKREDASQITFVLKLLHHRILERRNNTDFYAGETYVGSTLEAVKIFCARSENTALVTKWGRTIEQKEGK